MNFPPFDRLTLAVTLALLTLTAAPATAQDAASSDAESPAPRTVIKATIHIEAAEAESVLGLLGVDYAIKPDQDLIVLRGESYAVETAIKVIDALDQPRPSIDLQVYVLAASKGGEADVPEALEAAVDRLRGTFGYHGFKLLDNVMLRVLEGRSGRADGGIHLGDNAERTGYEFAFQKVSVVPEEGFNHIRIKGLSFDVSGGGDGARRASLKTDIKIREGQKAVIGSSTPEGIGETLILIVEANASPEPSSQE